MSLIFDRFKTRKDAEKFAARVTAKFSLHAAVYDSQEESNKVDVFPFQLTAPIVLVERPDPHTDDSAYSVEESVEQLVEKFHGEYAGT